MEKRHSRESERLGPITYPVFFLIVYSVLTASHGGLLARECLAAQCIGFKDMIEMTGVLAYAAAGVWHLAHCVGWVNLPKEESESFESPDSYQT